MMRVIYIKRFNLPLLSIMYVFIIHML